MKTNFLGKKLKNPTVLASGILGNTKDILERVYENGCALVTMKSIGPKPWDGHNNPGILDLDNGIINAVGLPTPGCKNMDNEWEDLKTRKFPLIASIYGETIEEYKIVAQFVSQKKPDFIEINISCPNLENHGMIFGINEKSSFEVVSAVKKVINIPLIAKLTPQAANIGNIAKACQDAGADAICAVNTIGPGMVIDLESRRPVLAFKKGGISGPLIKPIAIRCVFDIYKAVNIPIIGLGGIARGVDAMEMIMAGASLVGIGSAVRYRGINVFQKILKEMETWLFDHDLDIKKIKGAAHKA